MGKYTTLICECVDQGCLVKHGKACAEKATRELTRIDMDETEGHLFMCDSCGEDAVDAGTFRAIQLDDVDDTEQSEESIPCQRTLCKGTAHRYAKSQVGEAFKCDTCGLKFGTVFK